MRRFQEFKGQSTCLDYNRERGEFVARPVPHPFVVRSAASEIKTEPTEFGSTLCHCSTKPAPCSSRQGRERFRSSLPLSKVSAGPVAE